MMNPLDHLTPDTHFPTFYHSTESPMMNPLDHFTHITHPTTLHSMRNFPALPQSLHNLHLLHLASSALILLKELKLLVVSPVRIIVPKMNFCLSFPLTAACLTRPTCLCLYLWQYCRFVFLFNDHLLTNLEANPDPEVRSNGRVFNAAYHRSARPDLRVRIRHCCIDV